MIKPNVVLTTVHRLPAADVAPFFLSLRRCEFPGKIVVFASGIDRASILQLQRWGAQVETFHFRGKHVRNRLARLWPIWRRIFASSLSESLKFRLAHRVLHLFYRRHLLYLEFLQRCGAQYERFFLSDCRDVFFQKDPFSWKQTEGLHLFLEADASRIGTCPHHRRWIASQFGEPTLNELSPEVVSCAGTVFGDRTGLSAYLREMIRLTMQAESLREADGDQGLHNVLVRKHLPPHTTIHANSLGPVMTVGAMKVDDLHLNSEGLVLNDAGEVVPVLHQYDRISELRSRFHRVLGLPE